uniref:Ubiquitin ligase complex F-box protein GRR1, putative n=1 Tax=Ganoderma boninense TaxID=34458 RepID=A0A5K1K1G6_9APHY|nr:Ubiquitin ligase complex F-box protein GRR1, putative [Ganoderma boninense]
MFGRTSQRKTDPDRFAKLAPVEIAWRDRQQYLELCGYMLRRRYHPEWQPSWKKDPTIRDRDAEDSISTHMLRHNLMDARRISDGRLVQLKRIATQSDELNIARQLSSPEYRSDPRNHCVPILDVFPDADDPKMSYIVMPFLRYVDSPPFESVENMFDCVNQLLEGLVFLHDHGIAHRDCAFKNLMMDATSLFPDGFHPMYTDCLPQDITLSATQLSRNDVPVTYYYVDFGISTWLKSEDTDRLVMGSDGLDQDVPELSDDVPYDPFKADIFILGNFFRQNFTQVRTIFLFGEKTSLTHQYRYIQM